MSDMHEVRFRWPHGNASDVIVTGSFDEWSRSLHLARSADGSFEGAARVPWGTKVIYKFIVDGRWTTNESEPIENDDGGNPNNVHVVPEKLTSAEEPKTMTETVAELADTAKETAVSMVEAIAPDTTTNPAPDAIESPAPAVNADVEPASAAESAPVPIATSSASASEPAQSEQSTPSDEITAEAILPHHAPGSPDPVAPIVPIHILPLEPLQPESDTVPGSAIASDSTNPNGEASGTDEAEKPSTHAPAGENGVDDTARSSTPKPNGTATSTASTTPQKAATPSTSPTTSPKTPSNTSATLAANGSPNGVGKGSPASPSKEKHKRFPSLRRQPSSTDTSVTSGDSSHDLKKKDETPRPKRLSIFGRFRSMFGSSGN
ncbi:carbohydrate-binding module family 48 protein [Wolfiporia cocos MD-104 SS10]|uniref:Carbohydrate-binding module family 48 protein n=1 Tax=Wolfiporia cocos (strain MD-104) TaxID=742152 RepID=A0A2H3JY23_WOLCO|nr:carbohydrate-binding module family 48 protein [Wolfiporia cocos MD-104 SS10]